MAVVYSYCAIVPPINIKCAAVIRTGGQSASIASQVYQLQTNTVSAMRWFSLNYELVDEHSERHGWDIISVAQQTSLVKVAADTFKVHTKTWLVLSKQPKSFSWRITVLTMVSSHQMLLLFGLRLIVWCAPVLWSRSHHTSRLHGIGCTVLRTSGQFGGKAGKWKIVLVPTPSQIKPKTPTKVTSIWHLSHRLTCTWTENACA